jgi:ArsR family transcriptional regulator
MQHPHLQSHARTAVICKALAHPTRLLIVEALSSGERCVCELTSLAGADISTVSRHLSTLKHAGIVTDDKRGNQVFYTLKTPCILDFLGCIERTVAGGALEPAGYPCGTACREFSSGVEAGR